LNTLTDPLQDTAWCFPFFQQFTRTLGFRLVSTSSGSSDQWPLQTMPMILPTQFNQVPQQTRWLAILCMRLNWN
jgi:hypothetical protein